MLQTKFKNETEQMAVTPKVWSFELWFLSTALIIIIIIIIIVIIIYQTS